MRTLIIMFIMLFNYAIPASAETVDEEIAHAKILNDKVLMLFQDGKYQEAIPLAQQSLTIRENVLGSENTDTSQSLNNLALLYEKIGQYESALPLYMRSLAIREKIFGFNHAKTAFIINNLAELYSTLGQYGLALKMYLRAIAIQEKILGPDHADTAQSLNNLAELYRTIGQYDKALPLYQRSLAIYEKALLPIDSEYLQSVDSVTWQTLQVDVIKDYHYLSQTKPLKRYSAPENAKVAIILNNLALLYDTLGEYDKALQTYQRALAIQEKVLGQDHDSTANSLTNLAGVYSTLGQYDKALPLLQRALAIQEKVFGPDHPSTANSLNILANLYKDLGQNDQALQLYERALTIREKVLGPEHISTAASLSNVGGIFIIANLYEEALPLCQRSLAILEKALGPENADTAIVLNNLAVIYDNLGQYDKALQSYQRALAIQEKVLDPDHASTDHSLTNLAQLYRNLGQYDKALLLLKRAYHSALSSHAPDTLKLVQSELGYFYEKNNASTSIFYLKGAVNTMQAIRSESRNLDKVLQSSLLYKNKDIYTKLADLLVSSGRLAEAQQVLAMLKEEEYFDFIRRDANFDTRSTYMNYNRNEKSINDRLTKLGNEGGMLAKQLESLNNQAKLGLTPEQERQRARIKSKLDQQMKLTISLLESIPQLLTSKNKVHTVEPSKTNQLMLRSTLASLGHGAVLLQYVVTDKRIIIFLTTPETLIVREAIIPATELGHKIREFQQVLQNPARDPRPLAQAMYQLLIAPVEADLKQSNAQTLMVSLDGNLRYLPLGALYDGKNYLAKRYPLAMYTEVAKDKLREKPTAKWRVAGLGTTRKIREFSPLPSVQKELEGIIYGEPRGTSGGVLPGDIFVDEAFTQSRLHKVLNGTYPVLHIASHFYFSPASDAQSFLLLGDGTQLSLAELRTGGWKFDSVDMMTLSACETALGGGRDENGREIEGFGALVQRQGAKGILATLWSVEDQSTAILMQSIYRLRQEKGLTKAEALREAQLELISGKHVHPAASRMVPVNNSAVAATADAPAYTPDPSKPYAHPYYWAPFILMGNWL